MATRPTVVVVGAGPTGVAAAILLGQYGVRTLVLDRWPDVYPQPRAVHLDDEVHRILARMGVAEEFTTISRPAAGLRLLAPDHRVLAQFDRREASSVNGFPQANMFDQPELESLLRRRMEAEPLVEFRGCTDVTAVDVSGERPVVHLTDIERRRSETIEADYVLGCDGANSVVRRSIGSTMRDLGFDQRWLVADVETERELGHWEGVHQVCDSCRAATFMRIGTDRYRWEFQLGPDECAADFNSIEALAPLLRPWTTRSDDLRLIRVTEYTFRAQVARRWRRGRVFLLGDAVHLTPPFVGQGMGAGIRDAANLAWKIAAVEQGRLPHEVLRTYQLERKPHATSMVRLAVTIGVAMTGGGRAGNAVRRAVVPVLPHLPGLRNKVVDSATPALRRSTLVRRRIRPGSLAGTLCPNVVLDDGRRLDQAAGDGFVLLTTVTPLRAPAGVLTLTAEPGSELEAWLRAGRARAALVRPDGTVMAAARSVERVLAALESVTTITSSVQMNDQYGEQWWRRRRHPTDSSSARRAPGQL